jgi:eukaryotic-like serine/threonine-protein kinase
MGETHAEVDVIFTEALEKPSPEARAAYLEQACAGDAALRCLVQELLDAHGGAGSFLEVPAGGVVATADMPEVAEGPGTTVGRYKLLQRIGEGAFGVVFMAEQREPIVRKVAVKIIKPGMDTREVIARFEAERQALALMDHPNIARVLDAGSTDSGRPYFVMELVRGIPITDYCDQNSVAPQERLELFMSVCDAIQHAHQKGIIHRDVKPSNILVTLHDDTPVVKVIDFGVAKAINQRLTEKTLFTSFRGMIGTPLYMSPEQAAMSGLDVDTRSDVYSLGVLLYELLTGTTPFDKKRLHEVAYDELRRIIREEDPPKPSTKISTLGDTATGICAHRRTEPKRLSAMLRGDLDSIVMKALEKDRKRRYDTAKEFAADIRRYLNHEPVEASPPSSLYRLRKLVRRNRTALAITALACLVLVLVPVGIWRTTVSELEATVARQEKDIADGVAKEAKEKLAEEAARTKNLKWLNEDARPGIEKLKAEKRFGEALALAKEALGKFPEDQHIQRVWYELSSTWTVTTTPPGATLSLRLYTKNDQPWVKLGPTPVKRIAVAREFYHWKIEADGFEPMEGCAGPEDVDLKLSLAVKGKVVPEGMVAVSASLEGQPESVSAPLQQWREEFFLDRFEVTNRQYMRFVDAGGYRDPKHWQHRFYDGGKELSRVEAMARFVDATGTPGPRTWSNGTYPADEDNYPVRGVSWYEAAAYAHFVDKWLPTVRDWRLASGWQYAGYITAASNVGGAGPLRVGQKKGLGPFGTYDMAGNVREWCWNEGGEHSRYILGGSWNEADYMLVHTDSRAAMDRSETNGFRCAVYVPAPSPDAMQALPPTAHDWSKEKPVSDQEFESIKERYAYQRKEFKDLHVAEAAAEDRGEYRHQAVILDVPYNNERMTVHLYLPKHVAPPYQAIIYFPGAGAQHANTWSEDQFDVTHGRSFVRTGRAVVFPVYKGTFERRHATQPDLRQRMLQYSVDLRAAVDYLQGRPDVRPDKLAYVGFSFGGLVGPIMLALEDRLKTGVLVDGGLPGGKWSPEVSPFQFAPRVKVPILMVNGRNDPIFPLMTSQLPLYRVLGTAEKEKSHRLSEAAHIVSGDEAVGQTSLWLDRYLGSTMPGPGPTIDGKTNRTAEATEQENLGVYLLSLKKYPEAEKCFKRALDLRVDLLGPKHQDALRATVRLATAAAAQGRNDEAMKLLDETLVVQRKELGPDHPDVQTTVAAQCELWEKMFWETCAPDGRTPEDYGRAAKLAECLVEARPQEGRGWLVAYALYRQGSQKASADALQKSLADSNGESPERWFLAAMVYHKAGEGELARDWYAAAAQWVSKTKDRTPLVVHLRQQAAALLALPAQWPPSDWAAKNWVEVYNRLVARHPNVARLRVCRGSQLGSIGRWEEAAAEYRKGIELDPMRWQCWEALGAVALGTKELEDPSALCRDMIDKFGSHWSSGVRMDMVVMCSLAARAKLDREQVARLADGVIPANPRNGFFPLGRGMAAYRCGRYEDAIGILPESGFTSPKDYLLALIFRAMTRHKLGDAYTARKLLAQARQEVQKQVPGPDRSPLPSQDGSVMWCMVHTALREAESLIAASGTVALPASAPTAAKGETPKEKSRP